MNNKTIHFSGLNGFRAIAALAVIIHHITGLLDNYNLNKFIFSYNGNPVEGFPLGGHGVTMFFVLSGFLITYLLLTEKEIETINIKKFYLRRILRIWPLYYLYLIIAIIIIIIFKLDFNFNAIWFYIFYTPNIPFILGFSLPILNHYWSLGVEEQFYAFWPWLVKKFDQALIPIIVAIITILIVSKLILHFFLPNSIAETAIHVIRFHCMMFGALGAIFYKQNNKFFLFIIDNKLTQICCWSVIGLVTFNRFHISSLINTEIVGGVTLCLIIGQIKIKNRIINLENGVCDYLGKISFSMYIIHPILIFLFSLVYRDLEIYNWLKYILVYFTIISVTIFISHFSYKYFEKYFLNFKEKFVVIKSSSVINS